MREALRTVGEWLAAHECGERPECYFVVRENTIFGGTEYTLRVLAFGKKFAVQHLFLPDQYEAAMQHPAYFAHVMAEMAYQAIRGLEQEANVGGCTPTR